jgi:peptidyl-prolyl cis-trans isomerase D
MALAFLRRHQRWFHVLLGFVILGFIVFYIPMFRDAAAGAASEEVGRVADLPITAQEYQAAYTLRRSQYERMYQRRLDPEMLKMMGIGNQVFDSLVEQRLVELESRRHGLVVSDKDLAQMVAGMPYFHDQGRFVGAERVRQALESQGQSIETFERALRHDALRKQLEALVTDGVSVTPAEVEAEYKKRNEEIKVEYVLVDTAKYAADATATDDEVKARFDAAKEAYRIPEKRAASYVWIDPQALRSQVAVTDAEIETHRKANEDKYTDPEQVCARHVLVKVKDEAAKEGRTDEQAKAAATEILAQLKGGADFATVAKKSSEDTGSAPSGGDLGCFGHGSMVQEFDTAAFGLKEGELSDLVKTQYGYHIIKVSEHRAARPQAPEVVKNTIRMELTTSRAQALAEQKSQTVAAALAKGTKLEDAARNNGLQPQTSAPVGRQEPVAPFDDEVVRQLFDLKAGETTKQAVPLRGGSIFLSLTEVKPAHLPEIAEVKDKVKADVLKDKALEQARTKAEELKAKAGAGLDKAAAALGLTRKETPAFVKRGEAIGDIPAGSVDEAAFALAPATISDPLRVPTGYAVLRVVEKKEIDPAKFDKEKESIAASLLAQRRTQLFDAYLTQMRRRFPVEKREDILSRFAS